jgi:hypothetical protein
MGAVGKFHKIYYSKSISIQVGNTTSFQNSEHRINQVCQISVNSDCSYAL